MINRNPAAVLQALQALPCELKDRSPAALSDATLALMSNESPHLLIHVFYPYKG